MAEIMFLQQTKFQVIVKSKINLQLIMKFKQINIQKLMAFRIFTYAKPGLSNFNLITSF